MQGHVIEGVRSTVRFSKWYVNRVVFIHFAIVIHNGVQNGRVSRIDRLVPDKGYSWQFEGYLW